MKFLITFGFCCWFLSPLDAAPKAKESKIPSVEDTHKSLFSQVDHLHVTFKQNLYRKLRNKTLTREGEAYFSKPAKFRWVFSAKDKDAGEEYIFDGNQLVQWQKKEKTALYFDSKSNLMQDLKSIVDLVLEVNKVEHRYHISQDAKNPLQYSLKPKSVGDISLITLKLSESKSLIENIEISYTDGNNTAFSFSKHDTKSLSPSNYEFKNPGDVKVKKLD